MNYEWLILYRDNLIAQAANLFADGRTVDAGAVLAEARTWCKRGEWGALLAGAGIGGRRAQRAIQKGSHEKRHYTD